VPYEVKVDIPERGEQDVFIQGLGTFKNGSTNIVDDEQMARYAAANAVQLQSSFGPDGEFKIHNSSSKPKNGYGITFNEIKEDTDNSGEEGSS
jgi:hypothetical protein